MHSAEDIDRFHPTERPLLPFLLLIVVGIGALLLPALAAYVAVWAARSYTR